MTVADRWEQLSERARAVIGRTLPPPGASGSPEFDELMRQLKDADPALFREVLDTVTGGVALPAEKEAAQEHQRQRILSTILSPFRRPDGLRTGRHRKNTTALLYVFAAGVVALALFTQSARPPSTGKQAVAPTATPTPQTVSRAPVPPQSTPAPVPPPAAERPDAATTRVPQVSASPSSAPREPAAVDLPLPPVAPEPEARQAPPAPPAAAAPPQQAVLYRARQATQADNAGSAVLFRGRPQPQQAQAGSHLAFKAEEAGQPQGQPQSAVLFRATQGGQVAPGQAQTGAQQGPPEAPVDQSAAQKGPAVHVGQVFQARLALPISVSPAWGAVPALAEVTDGPLAGALLWGQARMARDGSVEISFNQVIGENGRSSPFNGVAYDPVAGKPALSGQVRTVMPNMTQTILSSSLQAASEYFKARVQSQSVTITNGFVTVQQREPNFWDVYSQSLAQAMTPQTPHGSGPVVVAHLPKGTVISVIAMSDFSGGRP